MNRTRDKVKTREQRKIKSDTEKGERKKRIKKEEGRAESGEGNGEMNKWRAESGEGNGKIDKWRAEFKERKKREQKAEK